MNRLPRRRLLAAGAALLIAASTVSLGAYSYLKPTASVSAPLQAAPIDDTANATVYEIEPGSAQASFVIDEVLRGAPSTVVGTTGQVAGQFALNVADPSATQIGKILINARDLETDDDSRNRALGNRILNTDQYEYIAFSPTALSGLPAQISAGQSFTFQVSGELTIKDVTKPAVFDVTVTPGADGALQGSASTTINYADWDVSIPQVPFVASVADQVDLQLTFNASAA
jgi:polyisoprenoid-binding protein YceI